MQSNSPVIEPQLRDPKPLLPWPWRTFNIHLNLTCSVWELLLLTVRNGCSSLSFEVSIMSFLGWEDFLLEALSEVIGFMLSISHRLMWADLLESEEPHAVLIIEMTSCYGEIQRGEKNRNPGQSVHLSTDCRLQISTFFMFVLSWRGLLNFMNMSLLRALGSGALVLELVCCL